MRRERHHRTVEDLMTTGVLSVRESETIARSLDMMTTAGIHHLPVIDDRHALVGMLSDRDLVGALASKRTLEDPVGSVMTRNVKAVSASAHAHTAAKVLMDSGFHSLPVEGPDGMLVGIITARDFLAVAEGALRGVDVSRGDGE